MDPELLANHTKDADDFHELRALFLAQLSEGCSDKHPECRTVAMAHRFERLGYMGSHDFCTLHFTVEST